MPTSTKKPPKLARKKPHKHCACGGACVKCRGEHFSESSGSLSGVEIFRAGNHRGKEYTEADLDDMVRNFNLFSNPKLAAMKSASGKLAEQDKEKFAAIFEEACSEEPAAEAAAHDYLAERGIEPAAEAVPTLRVPGVLGHEETQEFLERSDLPAAAWATKVYRDGPMLKANLAEIPPKVVRLLKGKAYRTVSAEVYDEPPEGVPGKGKMLRRIAFLGGEIPQIKSLDDIPAPETNAEAAVKFDRVELRIRDLFQAPGDGAFTVFCEVTKFCQTGPNAGKPGPCPEDGSGGAATGTSKDAQAAYKTARGKVQASRAAVEHHLGKVKGSMGEAGKWATRHANAVKEHGADSLHAKHAREQMVAHSRKAVAHHKAAEKHQAAVHEHKAAADAAAKEVTKRKGEEHDRDAENDPTAEDGGRPEPKKQKPVKKLPEKLHGKVSEAAKAARGKEAFHAKQAREWGKAVRAAEKEHGRGSPQVEHAKERHRHHLEARHDALGVAFDLEHAGSKGKKHAHKALAQHHAAEAADWRKAASKARDKYGSNSKQYKVAHAKWAHHLEQKTNHNALAKRSAKAKPRARKHSETPTMKREDMLAKLKEYGFDVSKIVDAVPDEVLAEMLAQYGSDDDTQDMDDDEDPDVDPDTEDHDEDDDDPNKQVEPENMADDEIEALPDDQKAAAFAAKAKKYSSMAKKYAEPEETADKGDQPVTYRELGQAINRAVSKALKGKAGEVIRDVQKFTEEETASKKKAAVDAFCEAMQKEGKVAPFELDESDPKTAHLSLRQRLLRADTKRVVRKFKEGGKMVDQTELDCQMEEIRSRRPHQFGERIKAGKDGQSDDADTAKIDSHFEKFSEQFVKNGMSKEKLLKGFKAEKKLRPSLTAEEYLGT